jgi:hypothetical protein
MSVQPDVREGWLTRVGGRRAFALCAAAGCALVLLRSAIYILYEQSFFDSDQAIVGLMAKHLIEGRAFPLFLYGQSYMIAMDSYVAVPFFLVGGPSVATLHASLAASNCLAVILMLVALTRWGGLSPAAALVATSFFAFAPPLTAASLVEASANIGPFVYVVALWLLRERPLWFGAVLGVGFLHREFTIYAVPVLLLGDAMSGALWRPARVRTWLVAAVVALGTWQAGQALRPFSDPMGPGTRGVVLQDNGGSQVGNLTARVSLRPAEYPERARLMFGQHLPKLFGFRRVEHAIASQGRDGLMWVMAIGLGVVLLRAGARALRTRTSEPGAGWYLLGVGTTAACGYIATRPGPDVIDRYILLALFMPVGVAAVALAREQSRFWRGLVVSLVALWMVSSAVDHVVQARRYVGGHEPDTIGEFADALVRRGITVAEAPYWRAYKITFLTRERVKVASTDFVRIEEYQREASQAGPALVRIHEQHCEGGEPLAGWYLCPTRPGTPIPGP